MLILKHELSLTTLNNNAAFSMRLNFQDFLFANQIGQKVTNLG